MPTDPTKPLTGMALILASKAQAFTLPSPVEAAAGPILSADDLAAQQGALGTYEQLDLPLRFALGKGSVIGREALLDDTVVHACLLCPFFVEADTRHLRIGVGAPGQGQCA